MGMSITSQRLVKMQQFCFLIVMLLTCTNGLPEKRYYFSPEQMGLKPANEISIPNLVESASIQDDPQLDKLNTTDLRLRLGKNFDASVMSIDVPDERDDRDKPYLGFKRNQNGRLIPTGTMPKYLSKIDFKYLTLTNGSEVRTNISPKLKRKIKQFLWMYTACSIAYRWKDLGKRFWPRYLKTGHCPQEVSCSIPPGMTCKPSSATYRTVLRWYCKESLSSNMYSSSANSHRHCRWIEAKYPVITQCSCSCPSSDNNY